MDTADLSRDLVVRFLAELMRVTNDALTPEAFQEASQAYFDNLRLWLDPADCPARPRELFTLFDDCAFDDAGERVAVRFSPEGEAYFRAWVRRQVVQS
jgi:hypothetical protein